MALAGAGNRDALLFRDGSTTYDLLRLRWRSSSLHTYATSGEWVSSLIDGDDPTADKAWTRIGATFAAPDDRGNTASVDSVSFPLEYSIDGGLTWVTVEDTSAERRDPHPDAGSGLHRPALLALSAAAAEMELGQ